MPMSDAGMSAAIKSALEAIKGGPVTDADLQKFCDAMGQAIVEYVKANAQVHVSGVQSGAGTATGTIS